MLTFFVEIRRRRFCFWYVRCKIHRSVQVISLPSSFMLECSEIVCQWYGWKDWRIRVNLTYFWDRFLILGPRLIFIKQPAIEVRNCKCLKYQPHRPKSKAVLGSRSGEVTVLNQNKLKLVTNGVTLHPVYTSTLIIQPVTSAVILQPFSCVCKVII